jgi:hypothetical protein
MPAKIKERFKMADMHGIEAKLSLEYKTLLGGVVSLLVLFMIVGYGVYELVK